MKVENFNSHLKKKSYNKTVNGFNVGRQYIIYIIIDLNELGIKNYLNKEEGKYQESIQSSTTPDPGLTKHKETSYPREPRLQAFPGR